MTQAASVDPICSFRGHALKMNTPAAVGGRLILEMRTDVFAVRADHNADTDTWGVTVLVRPEARDCVMVRTDRKRLADALSAADALAVEWGLLEPV